MKEAAVKLLNILPQEKKFYRMLEDLAAYAYHSAQLLNTLVTSTNPEEIHQAGAAISDTKNKAKALTSEITAEVCRTFITPFDREDIQEFAHVLYNIPKLIEKIQDRLITHKLLPFQNDFNQMMILILHGGETLEQVIKKLGNGRNSQLIHELTSEIHDLEDKGDQLLGQLIANVFWSVQDTREVILRKDIYEMLERVTDFYRDAANVAQQIILKHS